LQPNPAVEGTRHDKLSDGDFAELWLAEAERREAEMDSGQVAGILGEEVFRRIRERYNK
jgi:hypothetical protein